MKPRSIFPAGYAGNSILLCAVESDFDALFVDEHSHYCVFEAAAQSGRPLFRFRHRDADDLADNLRKHLQPGQRPLVMTDGVFSVRGTIAPLADYVAALANYPGAGLLVDDAHGVGVLGHRGRGTLEHFGLFDGRLRGQHQSPAPIGGGRRLHQALSFARTLSKALGGYGGIIPGSHEFIERRAARIALVRRRDRPAGPGHRRLRPSDRNRSRPIPICGRGSGRTCGG